MSAPPRNGSVTVGQGYTVWYGSRPGFTGADAFEFTMSGTSEGRPGTTAQGFASIGYQWTPSISTSVGYRAIYTDYRDGGFLYSTTQHGLYSSLAYHF